MRRVLGLSLCVVLTAAAAFAQERFHAADVSAIAGMPGLRIVSVRDSLRNRCYLAFIADQPGANAASPPPSDVAAAAVQRDRELASLVQTYENDFTPYAGVVQPNSLKYQVLAQSTQINFLLTALQSMLARLEAQLDRATAASRTALAVIPDVCGPADAHAPSP